MADTVHNWDIDVLSQIRGKLSKVCETLKNEKEIMTGITFELQADWQGQAGNRYFTVSIENKANIDALISGYDSLIVQLDNVINKCYAPCEAELQSITARLQ